MKRFTRATLLLLATLLIAAPALAEKKDISYFFKKPQFAGFQVSPNGKYLAALAPTVKDRMNIVVMELATRKAQPVTGIDSQDINGFQWANDERILFTMDIDGSESAGLFAVNRDGTKLRTLAEPIAAQIRDGAATKVEYTQVVDLLDSEEDYVLVINNKRRAAHPDLYRMNIHTGKGTIVERNPGNVQGWFIDWDGNVIGAAFQDGIESGFLMKNQESGEWEEIVRARYDEPSFAPVFLSGDNETGLVSSYLTPDGKTRDKAAIYEYNFRTRTMGDLVFEHDEVDVAAVISNEKTRSAIGVAYAVGKPEQVWIDERWKQLMASIDQALPDTLNSFTSIDDAENVGVLAATSDQNPTTYYLFDFEKNELKYLADSRPWMKPEELAKVRPITVTARDGMVLHGYLTLPPGSDGKNLPTVVNPHGGPWARDGWGFNPELQFLADRGYAVLQVNFRGSTGFGREHMLSSRKQWGQAMQNDITDTLQWAVEQGITNPDRVCIYGASYGGYATMAGLTFTPELYKCGINYVGVTDLPTLFKTAPDTWAAGKEQMYEMVGHAKEDREFLEQWSPANHADRIQAPVFMAYGLNDPRVTYHHRDIMEKAMDKAGVEYETMTKTDEGHGFRKQENVYDFYGRVDSFLAEHLNP